MPTIYVAPESAAVLDGYLIPGELYIKALVDRLRLDLRRDQELAARWDQDPRAILGERGIVRDLQSEILREQGLPVEQMENEWCISTGSCCCETL
jgi:hypothetical protein